MKETITKILTVEDEAIVAADIQDQLSGLGYDPVGEAATGQEALEQVESTAPDLILMDIMLKGPIDGIETANRIRERFGLPIVFLTAYSDESTLSRAKVAQPYGYLLKPFETRELKASIEVALYKHHAEKEKEALIQKLTAANARIKSLTGLLPICCSCKKIRDDRGYWQQVEEYVQEHSEASFTHSICPCCMERERAALAELREAERQAG